ncbi:hypothetical protein LCGC14_2974830, partial [marine sediment metagenome]
MTTVSTSFTAVGVSTTLRLQAIGEDVTVALSGTYAATVQLERALSSAEDAWEAIYPPNRGTPWGTANATVSDVYKTQSQNERLRLRCTSYTSGTVVTTIADGDLIIHELKDRFGKLPKPVLELLDMSKIKIFANQNSFTYLKFGDLILNATRLQNNKTIQKTLVLTKKD